jgi:hypothetical protein
MQVTSNYAVEDPTSQTATEEETDRAASEPLSCTRCLEQIECSSIPYAAAAFTSHQQHYGVTIPDASKIEIEEGSSLS